MNSIDQQLIKIALSSDEVNEEVLDEKKKNKKKPYDSMYIGNGNPAANIKFFNRYTDGYLNGTIKAQSSSAADSYAAVMTAGATPDGGNSVSLGGGEATSACSAATSAGGEAGGACCEDLEINEAFEIDPSKFPSQITLLSKASVEAFIDKLEPEELFAVGYLNPVYLYKELWEYLPIYKCTEFLGFTGVDFSQTQDEKHMDQAKRVADAKDQIELAKATGKPEKVGADVVYSSQNKLVYQSKDANTGIVNNTLLFYPTSILNIKYYVKFPNNPNEFVTITADQLEHYIYDNLDKIAQKVFDDPDRAAKWQKKISTYFGKDAIDLDRSTRSNRDLGKKYIHKYDQDKIAVRALYTDRIYYLDNGKQSLGKKLAEGLEEEINIENKYNVAVAIAKDNGKPVIYGYRKDGQYHDIEPIVCDDLKTCTQEVMDKYCPTGSVLVAYPDKSFAESMELNEVKRYVRRYYIKPQDIFCSNKAEILKALVDHNDEDCIIYTLNNLGDVKDTGKLTDNDIIYYYKDGILYDKNEVRVMDYDLSIKHEEDREKINPNTVSDAKYKDVYDDRITELSELEEALLDTFDDAQVTPFVGKEVKVKVSAWPEPKDGKIVSFRFEPEAGNLIVEVEVIGEKAHKFFMVEQALKSGALVFKAEEDQQALKAILDDNKIPEQTFDDIYKPETPEEREARRKEEIEKALQLGREAAKTEYKTVEGIKKYNKYKREGIGYGVFYNPYVDGYLQGWEEAKIASRSEKSAKTAEEKIDDQVIGGEEIAKLANDATEAWLMTHVTGIKFALPDFNNLPDGAPKTLGARLNATYDALEKSFPGITSNSEHFELIQKSAEPEKAWYGKWGLNGTIKFTVEFSKFPEDVRKMADEAVKKSQEKNHDALPVREDAKMIQNIYFCFAVLDLFDGDLDFYKLSDEDAAAIADANPFDQTFESLKEADAHDKCCICGEDIIGYGNNAEPYASGRCCDACNLKFVIPARIDELKKSKGE